LAQVAVDVALAEILTRSVEQDRFLFAELMAQQARKTRVRTLGHARSIVDREFFFGIVVNQEVLCLQNTPAEVAVFDLILPEVTLCARRCCGNQQRTSGQQSEHPRRDSHFTLSVTCSALTGTTSASPHS